MENLDSSPELTGDAAGSSDSPRNRNESTQDDNSPQTDSTADTGADDTGKPKAKRRRGSRGGRGRGGAARKKKVVGAQLDLPVEAEAGGEPAPEEARTVAAPTPVAAQPPVEAPPEPTARVSAFSPGPPMETRVEAVPNWVRGFQPTKQSRTSPTPELSPEAPVEASPLPVPSSTTPVPPPPPPRVVPPMGGYRIPSPTGFGRTGNRMSFGKGKQRHQFRPTGFGVRPPGAPGSPQGQVDGNVADPVPQDTGPEVSQNRRQVPPPPPRQPQGGQQHRGQQPQQQGGQGRRDQRGGRQQPQQNQPRQGQQPQQGRGRQQQPPRGAPLQQPKPRVPTFETQHDDLPPEEIETQALAPVAEPIALPLQPPVVAAPVAPAAPKPPAAAQGIGFAGPTLVEPPAPPTAEETEALASFAEDIELEEEPQTPAKRREPTGREMLINVVEGEEVRIAVVRKGQLEELYMERSSTESHVGNIYKGRVTNVEPSIQAAFVDFGIGKNGFLHISDVHPQYFPKQYQPRPRQHRQPRQQPQPKPVEAAGGEQPATPPVDNSSGASTPEELQQLAANSGPVAEQATGGEQPVVTPAPGVEQAGVYGGNDDASEDYDDFEVDDGHMQPMERVGRKTPRHERPPIQQALRRGQEVIVQVTKEGIGTKGPTLTSYISCPGRYLVMMPGMSQLGVSRKIEDEQQRRELRKILEDLNPPKNLGFIIRTAGLDVAKRELQGDLSYLVRMWKVIANRIRTHRAPVELYQESDLVIRTIRDVFNDEIDRIVVDNEQVASRIRDFLSIVNPRSAGAVELYTGTMPIFQKYGVEKEIEKIHSRRVEMPNGGSLVIDSTEALVAIDVNSGRYREMRDAELTAFNMNKEAVKEVVRQLRLRDLGGVVVIDFIDMRDERHKREIERLLREYLKDDRAKTKVLRMSQFCMVELTRQRVRPSLKRSIYMDCPHCHGSALIKTPESVSLDVMRRVAAGTTRNDVVRLEVKVYPTVAEFLLNRKRKSLVELEDKTNKRITINADRELAGDGIVIEGYDARGGMLNLIL